MSAHDEHSPHAKPPRMEISLVKRGSPRTRTLNASMSTLAPKRPRPPGIPPHLQDHLDILGVDTIAGYKRWCYSRGLSTSLEKTETELQIELEQATTSKASSGPPPSRLHRPVRAEQLRYLYENRVPRSKATFLSWYAGAFEALFDDDEARHALFRLLIHTEKYTGLFENIGRFRRFVIPNLVGLARRHKEWNQPIETWYPKSAAREPSYWDMVRHLLARYEVPGFLDRVWLMNPALPETPKHQNWYLHVANGGNIRTAPGFFAHLTKRMAHIFMQAPRHHRIEHAVRWAQVKALGGDDDLARAVIRTRLGEVIENEDFWITVIQFFINNPMLDPAQVGPIVDYIYIQKYAPQDIIQPGGGVIEGPPAHPNFCIKARSADKLVRLVEEWHGELSAQDYVALKEWTASKYRPFELTETDESGIERTWTIHELLSSWELALEGKALSHCVRSYANRCVTGKVSIWSTQARVGHEEPQNILTVAVNNTDDKITQYRGKFNMTPGNANPGKRKQVATSYVELLRASARILRLWGERERLRMK